MSSNMIMGVGATLAVVGAGCAVFFGKKEETVTERVKGAMNTAKRELITPSPNTVFARNLALFGTCVYLIKYHGDSLTMSQ